MSTGGIFTLITNSGEQDAILLATGYLEERIKTIQQINLKRNSDKSIGVDNSWLPDINMINKTHAIFVDGSFKPYVASAFEYNMVQASNIKFGNVVSFTLPRFGDFINDCVVHIQLAGLRAINSNDRVRYASFLGHKLFTKVEFKINQNILDEYGSDAYNAYYQFHVPQNKRIGWMRNMGQEIPHQAFLTADPTTDFHREYRMFGDGNQTFKQSHDKVDLWIPILFWFKDIQNSLPNGFIPFGQTNINVTLANISEIVGYADYGGGGNFITPNIAKCELYMNNIFMNSEVCKIFLNKFGFSLIRVHVKHTKLLEVPSDKILLNGLKWPTECLYISFRPIFNLTLSQYWNRSSSLIATDIKVPVVAKNNVLVTNVISTGVVTDNTVQLTHVSGPALSSVNNFYINYDLVINGGTGYISGNIETNRYIIAGYNGSNNKFTISNKWYDRLRPDKTTTFELYTPQIAINTARYFKEVPTISTIEIQTNNITLFRETDEAFYNSYLPYRYGDNSNTPEDRGWYMVNFNFFPGAHQPSGHINLSKARDFYLKYTSSIISQNNTADLIVLADAINFLLVKDGNVILRYNT